MRSRRSRMEANKHVPRPMACARTDNSRALNLALQGGGAHGAFTWGVLDRLLEDELIEIEGISGTSAGAMNAAVLAKGFVRGGKEGARKALDDFWRRIASLLPAPGGRVAHASCRIPA